MREIDNLCRNLRMILIVRSNRLSIGESTDMLDRLAVEAAQRLHELTSRT